MTWQSILQKYIRHENVYPIFVQNFLLFWKNLYMQAEMERLGFNPYGEQMEKRLKPDYSNSPKQTAVSKLFEESAGK